MYGSHDVHSLGCGVSVCPYIHPLLPPIDGAASAHGHLSNPRGHPSYPSVTTTTTSHAARGAQVCTQVQLCCYCEYCCVAAAGRAGLKMLLAARMKLVDWQQQLQLSSHLLNTVVAQIQMQMQGPQPTVSCHTALLVVMVMVVVTKLVLIAVQTHRRITKTCCRQTRRHFPCCQDQQGCRSQALCPALAVLLRRQAGPTAAGQKCMQLEITTTPPAA